MSEDNKNCINIMNITNSKSNEIIDCQVGSILEKNNDNENFYFF